MLAFLLICHLKCDMVYKVLCIKVLLLFMDVSGFSESQHGNDRQERKHKAIVTGGENRRDHQGLLSYQQSLIHSL